MTELLTTIITSAVVATAVGTLLSAWLEKRKSKWATKLDALKTAIELEGYAMLCANTLTDHETSVTTQGHAGQEIGQVPDLPEVKIEVGFLWPNRARVANQIMELPQEHLIAKQAVSFWYEVVPSIGCYNNAAVIETAKMGIKTLSAARSLRKAFGLPYRSLIFGNFNIPDVLNKYSKETGTE